MYRGLGTTTVKPSDDRRGRRRLLVYAGGLAIASHASAATYPDGPIQLVVPFSAGSGSDFIARVFAEALTSTLHQPVLVTNKPGAGGTIAAGAVAHAAADGRTLAVVGMGHLANPSLYKKLPYDTLKDFAAISPLGSFPNVLVVPSKSEFKSVRQIVTKAKAAPGRLSYTSGGIGSAAHINMQMLVSATGIELLHVPLKGAGEIVTEVTAGRCDLAWVPLATALGMVQAGRINALAISTRTRSKLLPDVPTIAEAGFPGATCNVWVGLLAPARTPRDVLTTLSEAIRRLSQTPAVQTKLATAGADPMTMTSAQFDALIRADYETLNRVMRKAN